jgi:hypothetical protein
MKTVICVLLLAAIAFAQNTTVPSNSTTSAPTSEAKKWIFGGVLSGANVVPTASKSSATGIVLAFYDGLLTLNYYIMHNVKDAVDVNFHDKANGTQTSPTLMKADGSKAKTLISGKWVLTPAQIGNLFNNMQYVDVTSKDYPEGEIRTTLTLAPYSFQYISLLDFMQTTAEGKEVSAGKGLMIAGGGFSNPGKYFDTTIIHSLNSTVTGAAIYGPADYCQSSSTVAFRYPDSALSTDGAIVYQFSSAVSENYDAMTKKQYFVQLNTASYPDGEIRGQILPPSHFTESTTLTGFEEKSCQTGLTVAPTTTAAPSMATNILVSVYVIMCISFVVLLLNV